MANIANNQKPMTMQPTSPYAMAEHLTGIEITEQKPGRAIWGVPGIGQQGSLHFEVLMSDTAANDLAIADLHRDGFPNHLSSKERYRLYCKLCRDNAKRLNDEVIEQQGMSLFVKRNGNPTRMLIILHKAIERSMSKFACTNRQIL